MENNMDMGVPEDELTSCPHVTQFQAWSQRALGKSSLCNDLTTLGAKFLWFQPLGLDRVTASLSSPELGWLPSLHQPNHFL